MIRLFLLLPILLTGCGTLPAGSGLRIVSGFSKDGPSAKAVLDIPFTQGSHERRVDAPERPLLIVSK